MPYASGGILMRYRWLFSFPTIPASWPLSPHHHAPWAADYRILTTAMWLLWMIAMEFLPFPSVFCPAAAFCCYSKFSVKSLFMSRLSTHQRIHFLSSGKSNNHSTRVLFLWFSLLCCWFMAWVHRGCSILPKEERFAASPSLTTIVLKSQNLRVLKVWPQAG